MGGNIMEELRNEIITSVAIDHPTKKTKTIEMPAAQMEAKSEEIAELEESLCSHYGEERVDVRIHKSYGAGIHQLIIVISPNAIT